MNLLTTLSSAALIAAATAPAQRTDIWSDLQKRYDKDGNGKVTADEYGRGAAGFANLDKNGDGVVTAQDFSGRARSGRGGRRDAKAGMRRFVELYASFVNRDGKSGVSRTDWTLMIGRLDPAADGAVAPGSLTKVLGDAAKAPMARMGMQGIERSLDVDRDRAVTVEDMWKVFVALDEDGNGVLDGADGLRVPPGVGEMAPDFVLPFAEDKDKEVKLSSFRGKKPVALIFGSYT